MKRLTSHTLGVLLAYLLLTILMTWPAALHLTTGIPGDGFDGWQNYWNLWWVKQALLVFKTNPFFTDMLYPPTGVSLLFHTLNIFNALWTLPVQLNFGLAVAYNSVVFFSFTLAGYGGYLLCLHTLTRLNLPGRAGLRPAAFVGGLVFTMAPFHFAHLLGHMQVFSLVWPPFYVLWLLRTLEPWQANNRPTRWPWHRAALTSLFLILATLVDWYHTLYLLIFTGLALAFTLINRRRLLPGAPRAWLRPLGLALAIGVGFAAPLTPLLVPMMRAAAGRSDLQTGLFQNITLSADLLAFVIPSEMHPLWGRWAKTMADNFSTTTSERLIFAGFTPLILAGWAAMRGWSKIAVKFWAITALAFGVLALGPYLHIGGKIVSVAGQPLPMPYLLLYYTVPFIGLTRSLSRYDLMVMLALGVLTAAALFFMFNLKSVGQRRRRVNSLTALVAALVCFEFLAAPYPISKIDTPDFFYTLAADTDTYTIAELPMDWDRPTPLLHQTAHGKPLLTAYTSRNNPLELAWRTPVLQHWRYLGPDIIDQPLAHIAPTIFYDFNLRYVVLDTWQMPPGPVREATEQWVAAAMPGALPLIDDGRIKVYQTPPRARAQPYLSLGQGWGERQPAPTGVTRALTAPATELFIHHPGGCPLELSITTAADSPQAVNVAVEGQPAARFETGPVQNEFTFILTPPEAELARLTLVLENLAGAVTVSRLGLAPAPGCAGF